MSGYLLKFKQTYSVKIGGRRYPVVKIGNQLWMAENLDYKFQYNGSTLPVGGSGVPSTPAAWYYDNDETTYGANGYKCGLLYNGHATAYLNDNKAALLPDGWHVPTINEWSELLDEVGGSSIAGTKLKAVDGSAGTNFPQNWNGTDEYGLSILSSGAYYGNFVAIERYAGFRTITKYSSTDSYIRDFTTSASSGQGNDNDGYGYSLRLVKSLA